MPTVCYKKSFKYVKNNFIVSKLASTFPSQVTLLNTAEHLAWRSEFWSKHQEAVQPACIFRPKSPKEVAIAVLICRWSRCAFAVKSGGHAAMKGAWNSDGGITIDLVDLDSIELSEDKRIARLGTGNTWMNVYEKLAKDGLAVVGGRASDIGVGGFTLGGGISFFASLYGWGCDNVANFEVVTASGGPNFGIVTRFDLETFPQGNIFAGSIAYHYPTQATAAISAFSNIAYNPDLKASTWLVLVNRIGHDTISTLTMYKDPNPHAEVFGEYKSMPNLMDTTKVRSLEDMTLQVRATNPKNLREMYWTHTFKFSGDFIRWFAATFFKELEGTKGKYERHTPVPVFQIITPECVARMKGNGGNCLPLMESEAPYMNLIYSCSWQNEEDDDYIIGMIARLMGTAVKEGKKRGLWVEYVYMNYASEYQDVLGGYGEENVAKLKVVAKKYDPQAIFQTLMPGYFKLCGAPRISGPGVWKED
ncbi:FAD-binding domain-containing protein [Lindgomyces ingoldianus]|uniref:FAD-binding domain-containing protein n=1 Tax=Lindgomyces ingoldianus TaxID=673940 RepID=A0ACB6QSY6_9PLEO|nr:FAD-binding domain-containing protein [Lindgomyces ingoldianus]KAF2469995.1 FAD-binding domain-containing protein [Lindgomyces ingoldianus]